MIETIQPEGWAKPKGYANGILADGRLYIGGQIGWNADQVFERHDFVGQMEQALSNIVAIVRAAGGEPRHITRLTWYVIDKQAYLAPQREVGEAYRRVMGRHFPVMTMVVVAGLIEDAALVEIEAMAELGTRLTQPARPPLIVRLSARRTRREPGAHRRWHEVSAVRRKQLPSPRDAGSYESRMPRRRLSVHGCCAKGILW